jgi:hypothetical protein
VASVSKRRRRWLLIATAVVGLVAAALAWALRFPPDTTPEGAYLRIAYAISRGQPRDCFAYLEEDAQRAIYTIAGYGKKASELIGETYPEPARREALARYQTIAAAADPPALWVSLADERGWIRRLRGDLSGVAEVQVNGERATVVTARGTRYPFRRRPNGIWGLTLFSAELLAEAEHLARDWDGIQRAAADYRRAGGSGAR